MINWRWWLGIEKKIVLQAPPNVSITAIVPAYNEAASIADTIRSLQAQTYPLDEII